MRTRRDVIRLAGAGALSAFLPSAPAPAVAAASSPLGLSIVGTVDVARALAENSLVDSVRWFDNNAAGGSRFLGTDHLVSAVGPGMGVTWITHSLEVETFVEILDMRGPAIQVTDAAARSEYQGAVTYWEGKVSAGAKGVYTYDLVLNVNGREMILSAGQALVVS